MVQSHPWFINNWFAFLQEQCTASQWRRAQQYVQNGKVIVQSGLGQFEGRIQDDIQYQIYANAAALSPHIIKAIVAAFHKEPKLLFSMYQRRVSQEDVKTYPYHLGFTIPQMLFQCSCENSAQPCEHSLAGAIKVAEEIREDYIKFLQLGGLNWDLVIEITSGYVEDKETLTVPKEDFGLVRRAAPQRIQQPKKNLDVPPFWTSSFSYRLMLQEIFATVKRD